MTTPITVPAGQAIPAAPAGTAWVFRRQYKSGAIELQAVDRETPTGDPPRPRGCTWRLVHVHGQPIFIAQPAEFLHHPSGFPDPFTVS